MEYEVDPTTAKQPMNVDSAEDLESPACGASSRRHSRQDAFLRRDVAASRNAHRQILGAVPLSKKTHLRRYGTANSDYLRALVFGGLDGIATLFATLAGCLGAKLTPMQSLIVGLGSLLANAIAMGFGEYLSSTAEDDLIDHERQKEEWEMEHCPEEEKREMVEIYEHRYGFSKEDAEIVITKTFPYKEFFISHMMAEELGLLLPLSDDGATPASRGLVMFTSFAVFGMVPLASFFAIHTALFRSFAISRFVSFAITAAVSCFTLFLLGVLKARFIANQKSIQAGLMMMLNGGGAGLVAYAVGSGLQHMAGAGSNAIVDSIL